MSNFGALTTGFTPPAACSATNVYLFSSEGRSMYMQAPTDTQRCFPSGYNPQVQGGFFSPAQCPVGYTTACISLNTISPDIETIVTCCPSYQSTMFACNTPHNEAPWQATLGCTSVFTPTVTLTSITFSADNTFGIISQKTETEGGMNLYSVQVRHRSGEFQTVTTVTTTVHTSTTMTLPVPGVTTTIPARDIDLLSPSALVAAACTAVFFLVPILVGVLCFYLARSDGRREARGQRVTRNEREGRPLLGGHSVSYQSTERRVSRPKSPPPPYPRGESSSARR